MLPFTTDADTSSFNYIIADDHPATIFAVNQMLTEVVGVSPSHLVSCPTSAELLDAFSEPINCPRIVVLDLIMPGDLKRAALVRAVACADQDVRVLVYTAEESVFLARAVIEAGATGYVAKTSPVLELIDALAAMRVGRRHVDRRIDLDSIKSHPWSTLTDSERAVLLAFCRGSKAPDIVATTGRSYSTVTTHKYNGLSKLGLKDGGDLLPYIYMNGLLTELDADSSAP
ncbi:response regulator [Pinirhizobacter soli]|uniref:response regulator n=1 Tax=Pinirhizobacter soli TaxID=2786953 RepID=UPI00202AB148|nr:response regulator transcription factor [Pinirhizobacter soli]